MKKLILGIGMLVLSSFGLMAKDKPEFPGGDAALQKFLNENVKYPDVAKENGVEGIVVVGFLVNVEGSLQDAKVLKFVDPDLEKEALRVVSIMPAWIPAEKDGIPVEAPSQVDVPFLLE